MNSKKFRAILAGGLVMGLGTAMTLASFTDQEFAKGAFSTTNFVMQGSKDGSAYADQDAQAKALELAFDASHLQPGDNKAQKFYIKNGSSAGTNIDVTFSKLIAEGDLATQLKYNVTNVEKGGTCDAAVVNNAITVGENNTIAGVKKAGLAAAGETAFCLQVSLPADVEVANANNKSATLIWKFDGAVTK